jgi:hypothetical protein
MHHQSDQPSAGRGRTVRLDSFGGPEVLDIREIPAPQAGPGQVRVRVTAAGLNPMDWIMTADADTAARFGLSLPAGFGTDYAGVVDQVGDGVTGFAPGDRVFGSPVPRGRRLRGDRRGRGDRGERGPSHSRRRRRPHRGHPRDRRPHGIRRPRRGRPRPGRHSADRRRGRRGRGVRCPAGPDHGSARDRDGIGDIVRFPARSRSRAGRLRRRPGRPGPSPRSRRCHRRHRPARDRNIGLRAIRLRLE